ncbi:MAG: D-2-hydroxyacid dehydrogenase [Deltaproteobacteria bacterium]|nr:D-2-hydroxyacid dehydrogenase [Deltaproteobacteria bacterium]
MTSLLILLDLPEKVRRRYYDHLRAKFPEVNIHMVDHHSKVGPYIGSADILLTFGPMMADHVLKDATKLKWIQALGTGVDGIVDQPSLRDDILITSVHGIHGAAVSEAAIMLMLALSRELPRVVRNQDRHKWDRFPARLLKDKTVGIFGVGAIAEELAPKCKAFGMTVVGISSTKREVAGFDRMYGRDELEPAVREVDYLVLLTPYSPATRGIVGAKTFSALKPTSYLVNLARGGVVDEEALIKALQQGQIAGAALDVFNHEPLPVDHPFWTMENVLITPHLGGFYDTYPAYALPVVEENLRRFLAGDTKNMINVVKR